jgi:hypothetical protein
VLDTGYSVIIPDSIVATNVNVATITFTSAQDGYALILAA